MAKRIGWAVAWIVIAICFAATVLPPFLDRIYYQGPVTDHYDGERFANPDTADDTLRPPSGQSRAGFLWSRLTGEGQPPWPDRVPVTPVRPADLPPLGAGQMRVTWVGHATALIETPGLNILTDPIWSDVAGRWGIGPERVAEPGVRFADLPPIDLVVVSHNHYDHMDVATLKRLWERDRPAIVTSLGNGAILREAGIATRAPTSPLIEADWQRAISVEGACPPGDLVNLRGVTARLVEREPPPVGRTTRCGRSLARVTVTRNHHWGSRWGVDRNRALWSSFTIDTPSGAVFFAGDTGLGDGRWPAEASRAAGGPIRLALVPIGAFRFAPGQLGTGSHIGPPDALRVWNRLGRPWTLPIHWGTFRLSSEAYSTPPRMLAELMRCAGGAPGVFAGHPIGRPWLVPPTRSAPPLDETRVDPCARTDAVRALR